MLNKNNWVKTGEYASITDAVLKKSGRTLEEIMNPKTANPRNIEGLPAAASAIETAIENNMPIVIVGDYDADGITSTAILARLITALGGHPKLIIPRRFSNGYGLSEQIVSDIHNSLLITVDNGISAVEQIDPLRGDCVPCNPDQHGAQTGNQKEIICERPVPIFRLVQVFLLLKKNKMHCLYCTNVLNKIPRIYKTVLA